MNPHRRILALLIATSAILLFALCSRAQTFSNAPAQYQTLLNLIDSIPTVPLDQAQTFIDTGVYNGPSVDTTTGKAKTVLQNFIAADFKIGSKVTLGGEMRNVLNHVCYGGMNLSLCLNPSTNFMVGPRVGGGYELDARSPQVTAEIYARYHVFGGAPYVFASAGYAETFGIGRGSSHSGGSGEARAGITLPFASWF